MLIFRAPENVHALEAIWVGIFEIVPAAKVHNTVAVRVAFGDVEGHLEAMKA